jgi:hypothetical protein
MDPWGVGHTDTVEISGVGQRLRKELLVDERQSGIL